jgi:hypothetical protein
MNRCPNCAALNRDGAKFCTSCGFRLPGDLSNTGTGDRSPFATTSTVPPSADPTEAAAGSEPSETLEQIADEWPPVQPDDESGPGLSWHSGPPKDTSLPVSDEMVASLVTDSADESEAIELGPPDEGVIVLEDVDNVEEKPVSEAAGPSDLAQVAEAPQASVTLDGLIQLARDLEYGLVEFADSAPGSANVSASDLDSRLLKSALNDLQTDEDLAPLRESIATAQERPRDVDVMLDLVLRADSIATLIAERDQLKHAIEIALGIDISDSGQNQPSETDEP